MRIAGEWLQFDDGITRLVVRARVVGVDERRYRDDVLVDTGANRTVLSAALLAQLRLPVETPPSGEALWGIGGTTAMVLVTTVLELPRTDGGSARVRGRFAAVVDPGATDVGILGRDVLHHFDVIVSRRRNEVLLLTANHGSTVTPL
jgi:predicted aspartyl protease